MGLVLKAVLLAGAFVGGMALILMLINTIPGVDISVVDVLKTLVYARGAV